MFHSWLIRDDYMFIKHEYLQIDDVPILQSYNKVLIY